MLYVACFRFCIVIMFVSDYLFVFDLRLVVCLRIWFGGMVILVCVFVYVILLFAYCVC